MDNKKVIDQYTNYFLNNMVNNGASSAAVMIYEKGIIKFYKSTSHNWQEFYSDSSASKNCHIATLGINLVKSQKQFSIIWDSVKPTNDDSLYLNEQRERYNHCHGISICENVGENLLLGVILTGRRCDVNFAHLVVKEKHNIVTKLNNIIHFSKALYLSPKNTV